MLFFGYFVSIFDGSSLPKSARQRNIIISLVTEPRKIVSITPLSAIRESIFRYQYSSRSFRSTMTKTHDTMLGLRLAAHFGVRLKLSIYAKQYNGPNGHLFLRRWRPHDEERHAAYYYASRRGLCVLRCTYSAVLNFDYLEIINK